MGRHVAFVYSWTYLVWRRRQEQLHCASWSACDGSSPANRNTGWQLFATKSGLMTTPHETELEALQQDGTRKINRRYVIFLVFHLLSHCGKSDITRQSWFVYILSLSLSFLHILLFFCFERLHPECDLVGWWRMLENRGGNGLRGERTLPSRASLVTAVLILEVVCYLRASYSKGLKEWTIGVLLNSKQSYAVTARGSLMCFLRLANHFYFVVYFFMTSGYLM